MTTPEELNGEFARLPCFGRVLAVICVVRRTNAMRVLLVSSYQARSLGPTMPLGLPSRSHEHPAVAPFATGVRHLD